MRAPAAPVVIGYVRRLWTGELPLARVFWIDMLFVGTLINFVTLLAAILLFAGKERPGMAVAIFLLHIPYNILVFTGVWRSAAREAAEQRWFARSVAAIWFVAGFLI